MLPRDIIYLDIICSLPRIDLHTDQRRLAFWSPLKHKQCLQPRGVFPAYGGDRCCGVILGTSKILAELSYAGLRPPTGSSPLSPWLAVDEMDALEFIL